MTSELLNPEDGRNSCNLLAPSETLLVGEIAKEFSVGFTPSSSKRKRSW